MTIEFRCTSCNKLLRTSDDRAGARAKCPDCGTPVTVPRPGGTAAEDFDLGTFDDEDARDAERYGAEFAPPPRSRRPAAGGMKNCPMCGAEIKAAAVKCRHCGEMLGEPEPWEGRRRSSSSREEARRKVQGPAIAMLISFSLTLALLLIGLVVIALAPRGQPNRMAFPFVGNPNLMLLMGLVQGVICVVILIGAWQMRNLKSYGLAMTGSILSMIPYISPCCLLGLPFGIWSIVVLNDENVKSAFR